MKQNARGTHNAVVAMVGGPLKVPMIPGSQSYNKTIPILSLPGRVTDLNLALWYNSRIYDVDTTNSTVTFNADRDFPTYGHLQTAILILEVPIPRLFELREAGNKDGIYAYSRLTTAVGYPSLFYGERC